MPADVAEQRLRQAVVSGDLSPDEFVGALLSTMFSDGTPRESIDEFAASMGAFHPGGFRAMGRASAEDLREVLPDINVPTLLGLRRPRREGAAESRRTSTPLFRARRLWFWPTPVISATSKAPDAFNDAVRSFLRTTSD